MQRNKSILLFIVVDIALCPIGIKAQTHDNDTIQTYYYSLSGIVRCGETGELLPGVVVEILSKNKGSLSNMQGQYLIDSVQNKSCSLSAKYMGYEAYLIENVLLFKDTIINIILWPQWIKISGDKRGEKKQVDNHIFHECMDQSNFIYPGLLQGKVVDSITGNALLNAKVALNDKYFRVTDSSGYYRFTNLMVGFYTIYVEHQYYHRKVKSIKVKQSQNIELIFKLSKK